MKRYKIELLNKSHHKTGFSCGENSLDNYLHMQANQDIKRSLTAVYVLLEEGNSKILGFYTLSSSAISITDLPQDVSKKLPRYPLIPVTLIGRLAIDKTIQKQGIGEILLIDAIKRSELLSQKIGSMAVVVEALNKTLINFYKKFGFTKFTDKNQLFLSMAGIKKLNLT